MSVRNASTKCHIAIILTLSVVWNIHIIYDSTENDSIPISEGMVFLLKDN
jgi:hypothetical protein